MNTLGAGKSRSCCIVWGVAQPDWLAKGNFTAPELTDILEAHTNGVMGSLKGKFLAW